jgi:predicted phosphodiesterase
MHCPFNLPKEVFKDYVNKVDIIVFGGDIQDCQSISKFTKKYRVPFSDEMILTRQYIIDVIDYIKPKKVYFIKGNHEVRLINYLSSKISDDLLELMPETPLDLIINNGFYIYNHESSSKTHYLPLVDIYDKKNIELSYTGDWWIKIGDVIFSHPKAFKTNILSTTEKAYLYFLQHGLKFNCIVTAHTHASAFSKYGKCYMYESGSLCHEPDYAGSGNLQKPQSNGFLFLSLNNNHFDYENSKLIVIDN